MYLPGAVHCARTRISQPAYATATAPWRESASSFARSALGHSTTSGSDWLAAAEHFVCPCAFHTGGVAGAPPPHPHPPVPQGLASLATHRHPPTSPPAPNHSPLPAP